MATFCSNIWSHWPCAVINLAATYLQMCELKTRKLNQGLILRRSGDNLIQKIKLEKLQIVIYNIYTEMLHSG